jgi:hypothetical protein
MEQFYKIVIIVAIVFLILTLTVVGILLSARNNTQIYPPTKNDCPDYWKSISTDQATGYATCTPNKINIGSFKKVDDLSNNVPGYKQGNIDFSDSGWGSKYNTTTICALNKWTNLNNINWDGVSNYNGC